MKTFSKSRHLKRVRIEIIQMMNSLNSVVIQQKYPSNGIREFSCGLLQYDGTYSLSGIPRRKK